MSDNLITNGDFLNGETSGWNLTGTASIRSDHEALVFNWGNVGFGGVAEQEFATTQGHEHTLSFETSLGGNDGNHTLVVEVLDENDNVVATQTYSVSYGTSGSETITFVATSAVAKLRFSNPTSSSSFQTDLIVDNISVIDDDYIPPCFTAGTLIDTDKGPVPVETLQAGDMILTKDHGFQPVKWVGESRVYASGFDVPLRIKKGTFGNSRDLVVSKRHKMLMDHTHLSLMFDVEEAFACAMHLRNDTTITREPEGWVTYYHVLLPQHEVIYAEGAATESFYPDEGTLAGMATGAKEELFKNFTPETYGPPACPTLDPTRAMWIGRNLDILNGNDMGQVAAYENAMKAAQ